MCCILSQFINIFEKLGQAPVRALVFIRVLAIRLRILVCIMRFWLNNVHASVLCSCSQLLYKEVVKFYDSIKREYPLHSALLCSHIPFATPPPPFPPNPPGVHSTCSSFPKLACVPAAVWQGVAKAHGCVLTIVLCPAGAEAVT